MLALATAALFDNERDPLCICIDLILAPARAVEQVGRQTVGRWCSEWDVCVGGALNREGLSAMVRVVRGEDGRGNDGTMVSLAALGS